MKIMAIEIEHSAAYAAAAAAYAAATAAAEAAYAAYAAAADYAAAARADYAAAARADYAADIAHRIESIAIDLAAKHVADPLVGDNATPSDADDFDATTLRRALAESGLASSEDAVEALRAELRLALGR